MWAHLKGNFYLLIRYRKKRIASTLLDPKLAFTQLKLVKVFTSVMKGYFSAAV